MLKYVKRTFGMMNHQVYSKTFQGHCPSLLPVSKTNQRHCPSLRGRNEAFRGLPQWQAVPSEGSTVLCATEDPIGSAVSGANGTEGVTERILRLRERFYVDIVSVTPSPFGKAFGTPRGN